MDYTTISNLFHTEYRRPLREYELKEVMGLSKKLPKDGKFQNEKFFVGDTRVFLLSAEQAKERRPRKNRPHRIFAICNSCEKEVPAGRLNQHRKIHLVPQQ